MVTRPYALRMQALRAAKGVGCGCGRDAHGPCGQEEVRVPTPVKFRSVPGGHKTFGALDSRGA